MAKRPDGDPPNAQVTDWMRINCLRRIAPAARLGMASLALLLALQGASPAQAGPDALRLVGLRGATTAAANTREAMTTAVSDLMAQLIQRNRLKPEAVVSVTFTATDDLDALFPASVVRRLPGWEGVALLDMQQLKVQGDLPRCIRVLLTTWLPASQEPQHLYLGEAARLRPDRAVVPEGPSRP